LFIKEFQSRSTESFTVYSVPAESHGKWDGLQPFEKGIKIADNKPVLVLTRARIRFFKINFFLAQGF